MTYYLYTTFYVDAVPLRNEEMLEALHRNIHAGFNRIFILCENIDDSLYLSEKLGERYGGENGYGRYKDGSKIEIALSVHHNQGKRPMFSDFVRKIWEKPKRNENVISVIANSDIWFDDLSSYEPFFDYLRDKQFENKYVCYALSRWDHAGGENYVHFDRADSQDAWVFYDHPNEVLINTTKFNIGKAGCDNRFAHELQQAGYEVLNPSKSFKTYHLHRSNVRNYNPKDAVPPPYLLVKPY